MLMSTIKSVLPADLTVLYPDSETPRSVEIPAQGWNCVLLFTEEADLERVKMLVKGKPGSGKAIVAYVGREEVWRETVWMKEEPAVPWVRNASLPHSIPLNSLCLYLGHTYLTHLPALPPSFPSLSLPPLPSLSSLSSLPQLLSQGQTASLIWAYSHVKASYGDLDLNGVRELLRLVGLMWEVEIGQAEESFRTTRWGSDPEDVIDVKDITFKQFMHRLRNFSLQTAPKSPKIDSKTEISAVTSNLKVANTKIAMLEKELDEKNFVIEELRRKIREFEENGRPKKAKSGENMIKIEEKLEEKEDNGAETFKFTLKIPSYQSKLATRKGFVLSPVSTKASHNHSSKSVSESPVFPARSIALETLTISPVLNSRPLAVYGRKKSPLKSGKTTRPLSKKSEADHSKAANRIVFANSRLSS